MCSSISYTKYMLLCALFHRPHKIFYTHTCMNINFIINMVVFLTVDSIVFHTLIILTEREKEKVRKVFFSSLIKIYQNVLCTQHSATHNEHKILLIINVNRKVSTKSQFKQMRLTHTHTYIALGVEKDTKVKVYFLVTR